MNNNIPHTGSQPKLQIFAAVLVALSFAGMTVAEERSLPEGYVVGDCIESTGDQYIDTGYLHNGDTVVECEVDVAGSGQPGNFAAVFGCNGTDGGQNSAAFEFWAKHGGTMRPTYDMYATWVHGSVGDFPYDEWVKIRCDKTKAEWHPVQNPANVGALSNKSLKGTPSGTFSLYIFGLNEKGTFVNPSKMKLRSFRIFEGDTLKRDFVPAKRLADGKVGLFDVLDTNPDTQFCVNQGSGELLFVDANCAKTATWTGGGSDPLNVADSANWSCINFLGHEVTAIPTNVTSVILPAGLPFNCTNGAPFVCKEVIVPAVLTANCDWRGIAAPLVGNLNLNGYNLYLSDLNGTARIEAASVGVESGYQQVEYIESSGDQYIDTGYLHKVLVKVECDVNVSSTGQPGNYSAVFGANGQDGGQGLASFEFWAKHGGVMRPVCGMAGNWAVGSAGDFPYDEWVTLTSQRDIATWCPMVNTASTKSLNSLRNGTAVGTFPLYIFGLNEKGTFVNKANMKLRRFRITEAGEVKRDFIPVRRLSDQALGLLDLQDPNPETQFHGNKGTGDFTAGAALPTGVGGEVHVEIAAGKTVTNPSIALAGAVKLVIEGSGTYKPVRHYQAYSGGTVVLGGTAWTSNSGSDHLYGVAGSEITIGDNGTMEMDGTGGFFDYSFVLAGGLLQNTTDRGNSSSSALIRRVRLEEDSSISFNGYSFSNHDWTPSTIDLGGHDLDLTVSGPCYFVNTVATNGTIVIHGDIEFFRGDFVGRGVTLDVDGAMGLNGVNVIVDNYIARTEKTEASYDGDLFVYGKFTPVTDNFWGCVLQDGATLNLSKREGPWNVKGTLVTGENFTKNTVSFADDATILVDLGDRKVKSGDQVIAWDETTRPANLDTLNFMLKGRGDRLWKASDGLYFPRGTMILFR